MVFTIDTSDPLFKDSVKLANFLETTRELSLTERETIVDQALILIDFVYVHLPLKKAMYAVNPVQRLKILRRQLKNLSERVFHNEMLQIFKELRDLHTNYILPAPYNQHTAFLPFLMEEYYDANFKRHYIVSKLIPGFHHDTFIPGVEITDWNGVPIDLAVAMNADREAGSNEAARHVRGLDAMTVRPMAMSLPPAEQWVIIGYSSNSQNYKIQLSWQVNQISSFNESLNAAATGKYATAIGLDLNMELTNNARKVLFARNAIDLSIHADNLRGDAVPSNIETEDFFRSNSRYPDTFQFRPVDTPQGQIGYLRIRTFSNPEPNTFVNEVIRILELLPQRGLIIDVRGNGGGIIMNGERILQLFSSIRVEAERLHFINNEITLAIANSDAAGGFAKQWVNSIDLSTITGSIYSQGFPIESPDITNSIGRRYNGNVVLITDARCYSTTDIFAAGFQDNKIGKILGVDDNTGAGGANVFTHDLLRTILPGPDSPFQNLPGDTKMRVAIRQTTRVGEKSGLPLEDLGVQPDAIHRITRDDVLYENRDLIAAAAKLLLQSPDDTQ
ncbi:S41 family peptidase [Paenibacillus alvei]|uniref:S41 family peptidase n=1 Tax=Paenibacillus alvei TaxID=44250 RepID=UPI0018CCE784|nr:S41 family peptidase [Paenibacillus alvei]MCY9581389.1 S41 family peptidase [Paenibacillus alvei]MCY9588278.1 S41 family peptidase [Paenibacillus alvei]